MLGDMLELGKWSADAHRKVGERVAKVADLLMTVGFRAAAIAGAARGAGMSPDAIQEYAMGESGRLGADFSSQLKAGDVVLVKGSQGMRMEKTVKELMAEPERAPDFLVRQDMEWEKR